MDTIFINLSHLFSLDVRLQSSRDYLYDLMSQYFSFDCSQLIFSMIFGQIDTFSASLHRNFKVIGMLHILSASGFNVSLTIQLLLFLLKRAPGVIKLLILLPAAAAYCSLAGGGAAVWRAGIMSILALTARIWLHRQHSSLWSLLTTAALMLLIDSELFTSLSFQLSFLATAGILLLHPILARSRFKNNQSQSLLSFHNIDKSINNYQKSAQSEAASISRSDVFSSQVWNQIKQGFVEALQLTVAAQLPILPILCCKFNQLSLLSFAANPALLWISSIIPIAGVVWLLIFPVFYLFHLKWMAAIAAWIVQVPAQCLIWFSQVLGQLDWTLITINRTPGWLVFLWWAGLLGWVGIVKFRQRRRRQSAGAKSWELLFRAPKSVHT